MPSVKNKWVKPSSNVPFSQGILAYNGTGAQIGGNKLVYISGVQGNSLKIIKADGSAAGTTKTALFVTKHRIPDGKQGVILPWKIVGFNTTGTSIGDSVYVSDTAGDIGTSAGSSSRIVGSVLVVGTIAAGGKVFLAPTAMMGLSAI